MLFFNQEKKVFWLIDENLSEYWYCCYKNASVYQHTDNETSHLTKKIYDTAHKAFWCNMMDEMENE